MKNPNKLPPDIEGIDKTLKDALWTAYCNGRAGNKYMPEEVMPGLKVKLTKHGVVVLDKEQSPPKNPYSEDDEEYEYKNGYALSQHNMVNASWRKVKCRADGTPVKEG